jgi:hypothetical protein
VAVFAHNEGRRICDALESIETSALGFEVDTAVLANGYTDTTRDAVRNFAKHRMHIRLIEIGLADKANAWNVYIHEALTPDRCTATRAHVFVDGDIRVGKGAIPALAAALEEVPSANAAGGMLTTGRDREKWRTRMVAGGTLAGGLYALRGRFVDRIREQDIRLPIGFIGEDWLVSFLAGTNLGVDRSSDQAPLIVFSTGAGFAFKSLDPFVPRDYATYFQRLWRYALREVQFEMLMNLLSREPLHAMPSDLDELYRRCLPLSRLKWARRRTASRFLAVQHVRAMRARAMRDP